MTNDLKNKLLEQQRIAAAQEEDAKRKAQLETTTSTKPHKRTSKRKPAPEQVEIVLKGSTDDWESILQDYLKLTNLKPTKNNALVFPNKAKAIEFFTQQAREKRKFFAQELANGKPTSFYLFSCGDGVLYQGDLKQIENALMEAKKTQPEAADYDEALSRIRQENKCVTSHMRQNLDNIKDNEHTAKSSPGNKM